MQLPRDQPAGPNTNCGIRHVLPQGKNRSKSNAVEKRASERLLGTGGHRGCCGLLILPSYRLLIPPSTMSSDPTMNADSLADK